MSALIELEQRLKAISPQLESLVEYSIKIVETDKGQELNVAKTWEEFLSSLSTTLYQKCKNSDVYFHKKISLFKLLPKS